MATIVKKEKNFIYLIGDTAQYTIDLNEKTLHKDNIKRDLISTQSLKRNLSSNITGDFVKEYPKTCKELRDGIIYHFSNVSDWITTLQSINIIEQICKQSKIANYMDIGFNLHYCDKIVSDSKILSAFTKWIQTNPPTFNALQEFVCYYQTRPLVPLLEKYNIEFDELPYGVKSMCQETTYSLEQKDFILWCECVLHLSYSVNPSILRRYFEHCEYLNKKPKKTHNITTEIYNTYMEYKIAKDKMAEENLRKHQLSNSKKIFFENEKYITLIPTTIEEIKTEAKRQNNCLESYIDDIANGRTSIVFIRDKSDIEQSLITCEIRGGTIRQFYLKGNRRACKADCPDLIDFEKQYNIHLLKK